MVELPAPSLELERAQPRVLVLRDILASNDPARLRTIVVLTSCNFHKKCHIAFPRRCALFSAMGKVLEPLRHRNLLLLLFVGDGGSNTDGRFMDAVFVAPWRCLDNLLFPDVPHG